MPASAQGRGPWAMQEAARLYVEHVRGLAVREAALASELEHVRGGAVRAQALASSSASPPLHGDDAVFALVERTSQLERELGAAMAECAGEAAAFARCLSELPDPRHRLLLSMRARGARWADTAAALGYSRSQALRLAKGAYVSLWSVMPEEWRRRAFPDACEGL